MSRLARALHAIDELNRQDPNTERVGGEAMPKELVYGQRMSECLASFCPDASEELQIAVRAQHVCRWRIARDTQPMDRTGYKKWRSLLARMHADIAGEVMGEAGYEPESIERTQRMLQKRGLTTDAEVQTLEDCACLVFLQYYFGDFAAKHPDEKVVDIVRKTWKKMSARGHAAALELDLPPELGALVSRALADPSA